jgi:hypothetical protein
VVQTPFHRRSIRFPTGCFLSPIPQALEGAQRSAFRAFARLPMRRLVGKAMNHGSNDRQWFRVHPVRFHRGRLATLTEIEDLREHGCFDGGARLADDCFIYALSRINRESRDLHRSFVVLRAGTGMDEARCSAAWFQSEVIAGQIERLGQ